MFSALATGNRFLNPRKQPPVAVDNSAAYQTRQAFSGIIASPFLQPKAFPNSSKSVSYTHLDVYKRQGPRLCDRVAADIVGVVVCHVKEMSAWIDGHRIGKDIGAIRAVR